jgi:predicted metal-dependent hydrolase
VDVQGCFVNCPLEKGFVQTRKNGGPPSCGFRNAKGEIDDASLVVLQQTPFLPPPPQNQAATAPPAPMLAEVQRQYPDLYTKYIAEQRRVESELKVVIGRIGKDAAIQLAFRKLQDAENARDAAPEAYIAAKNAYYTLTKGDSWKDEERKRVEASEVVPVVQQALGDYQSATSRAQQSSRLAEFMNAVSSRTIGAERDFRAGVDMLAKQLQNVKDQLQLERRKTEEAQKPLITIPILKYLIDILLGLAVLFAIVMVYRAIRQTRKFAREESLPLSQLRLNVR